MRTQVKHWQDVASLVLGVWLAVSPWVLAYTGETRSMQNAVILGIVIGLVAFIALFQEGVWEEWANAALGAWMIVSPWVLGFAAMSAATANAVVVGAAVLSLAAWRISTAREPSAQRSPAH